VTTSDDIPDLWIIVLTLMVFAATIAALIYGGYL
jgi:hypothetical protein